MEFVVKEFNYKRPSQSFDSTIKNKTNNYEYEETPHRRKRIARRLETRLRELVEEYSIRVGKQLVTIIAEDNNTTCKIFGSKPFVGIIEEFVSPNIMKKLQKETKNKEISPVKNEPFMFELPPLILDGSPISIEHMTQAQLRNFIPYMIRFSTGRCSPQWTNKKKKPIWWPKEIPWANVRSDTRSTEQKTGSWTNAMRQIIKACYKYHGREDLLYKYKETEDPLESSSLSESTISQSDKQLLLTMLENQISQSEEQNTTETVNMDIGQETNEDTSSFIATCNTITDNNQNIFHSKHFFNDLNSSDEMNTNIKQNNNDLFNIINIESIITNNGNNMNTEPLNFINIPNNNENIVQQTLNENFLMEEETLINNLLQENMSIVGNSVIDSTQTFLQEDISNPEIMHVWLTNSNI